MKLTRVEIDSGKGEKDALVFPLEKKIKEFEEGIDYEVGGTDDKYSHYIIHSERLKKVIWPDDYLWYNESVVSIDRQGKIESWRIAAENPRDPYKGLYEGVMKEILEEIDNKGISNSAKFGVEYPKETRNKSNDFHSSQETKIKEGQSKVLSINSWIIGCVLLLSIPFLLFFRKIKKNYKCQKKSKKNCETKQ